MGMFLNSIVPFMGYQEIVYDPYFVDKTNLIKELIPAIGRRNKYFCITRPRRFGKSVMANMVGAFFEKTVDSSSLFHGLSILQEDDCKKHMNQHHVIYIDFSRAARDCTSYEQYMNRVQDGIDHDLMEAYPDLEIDTKQALWDTLLNVCVKTGDRFIFVIDEWDALFHMPFIDENMQKEYLIFLKNLLKDQVYVELAYMTGVLPIAKYSSGSELNMFLEYDMVTRKKFGEYFGFDDLEVDRLYEKYNEKNHDSKVSREDLRIWYDGYYTANGKRMYNPRSIVCALTENEITNYWTSSGPYDEIFYYIRNNIEAVRDDLVLMISGEGIRAEIQDYAAVSMELNTKSEIYSAMVVYGLLTYDDETGKIYIPNQEIMEQFKKLLMTKESLGYVYRLANKSEQMLQATIAGDTKTMADILQFAHNTESPILSYNHEIELSDIVNLVYLAARDEYRVEREDKAGKGYVDFIFYPIRPSQDAIILELKVDSTPEDAIQQIMDKDYALRFRGELGEKPKYKGRILGVGIGYSKDTKEHECKVIIL